MTTTQINWNWGTNTNINFSAATDILDFGWFQADQFTISEVNGTVVIAIPSNQQTYTLQHTTLHDLHLSNIAARDASAISEWTTALGGSTVTAPEPPPPPVPPQPPVSPQPPVTSNGNAGPWSASSVYTAGMTVTENGITYKANWWTQGTDPADHNGASGAPWTAIAGAISNGPTPWSAGNVYTAGMTAIEDGVIYQANWWFGLRGSQECAIKWEEFWLCASPTSPPGSIREARQAPQRSQRARCAAVPAGSPWQAAPIALANSWRMPPSQARDVS